MRKLSPLLVACFMVYSSRCSAYSRIMTLNAKTRSPSMFRPGATMLRPSWAAPPRFVQAASNRSPYVLYKNPIQSRYVKPHYSNKFGGYVAGPWRNSVRLPTSSPVYEFIRASPSSVSPLRVDGDRGPIFTMPAPNLSLADKPIVVVDMQHQQKSTTEAAAVNKTRMYEVTEKTLDPSSFGLGSKFYTPHQGIASGPQGFTFSNVPSLTSPGLIELMRNPAAQQFQLSDTYPLPILQQPQLLRHTALGPQLTLQGFNAIMQPSAGTDPNILQQNVLFKPDPSYIQKITNQLYQRFPGAEFYQYPQESDQSPVYIVANGERNDLNEHFNVVRATNEGTIITLAPEHVTASTTTQNDISTANVDVTDKPDTTTVPLVTEPKVINIQPEATTIKLEAKTDIIEKQTPIYYPQVEESVGSIIANGFYSALTDVRAAEALALVEQAEKEAQNTTVETTESYVNPFSQANAINDEDIMLKENTTAIVKPHKGAPFSKAQIGNVYSFSHRESDNDSNLSKEDVRLAGQIVEDTISDDEEFHHERAALKTRRPQLRLYSNFDNSTDKPKKTEIKSKPKSSKSKLAIDEKTGEPVIRIYASYESNSKSNEEREQSRRKLSKAESTRSRHNIRSSTPNSLEDWKTSSVKSLDRSPSSGSDLNQVTKFGLKLRPRMDDFISIFDEE